MTKPPVPRTLDLRDFARMPLDVEKLLDSDTWLLASGDEAKAAITLWAKAWHQVPAGSLPNDERILAKLSGAGEKWEQVREVALRGFELCDDGRLYHPIVCEIAEEVFARRRQKSEAGKSRWNKKKPGGAAHKRRMSSEDASHEQRTSSEDAANEQKPCAAYAIEREREREREREKNNRESSPVRSQSLPPGGAGNDELARQALEVLQEVLAICNCDGTSMATVGPVIGWLQAGCDPELDIYPAIRRIAAKPDFEPPMHSVKCFNGVVNRARTDRLAGSSDGPGNAPAPDAGTPERLAEATSEAGWEAAIKLYRKGHWPETLGADPSSPDCLCPEAILVKHGLRPAP